MTVMIGRYFGMPQELVRSRIWRKMKPGEKDLYVCLVHRSERYTTRTMTVSDAEVTEEVGAAPRTCCNARKKLRELGLITYKREEGSAYSYELCDPTTGKPYPGPTKVPVIPPKQRKSIITEQTTSPQVHPPQPVQKKPSSPPWNEIGKP